MRLRKPKYTPIGTDLRGFEKSMPLLYAEFGAERRREVPYVVALPIVLCIVICAKVWL